MFEKITIDHTINHLSLTTRIYNALMNEAQEAEIKGIPTIRWVLCHSRRDLLRIPNFGRRSMVDLERALSEHGWTIGKMPEEITSRKHSEPELERIANALERIATVLEDWQKQNY